MKEDFVVAYSTFRQCLNRVNETITGKTNWKYFSREEKSNVENTVMLARLLYEMCNTNIIVKANDKQEEALETINEGELKKLEKDAKKLVGNTY